MNDGSVLHFWVYDIDGCKVGVDLPFDGSPEMARELKQLYLGKGFSVNPASVEAGEEVVTIEWISCLSAIDRDGKEIPRIGFYPEAMRNYNHSIVNKYLNTEADQHEFEQATGLQIADLPVPDSTSFFERGKNPKTDKYIVALPKPIQIAVKPNPKHDPNEQDTTKMKPKRLFARFLGATGTNSHTSQENAASTAQTGSKGHSSAGVAIPIWWNVVMAEKGLRALFNNVGEHFANKVKKMLREGVLTADMDARKVIDAVKESVEFDKQFPPSSDSEETNIPF